MRIRSGSVTAVLALVASLVAIPAPPAFAVCREPWTDGGAGVTRGYLWDVSALDASHAWAAGVRYDKDNNERFLTLTWDGSTWSSDPVGFSPLYANMWAVEALAPDDVWASGAYFDEVDDETEHAMFHFNGMEWSRVSAPTARSPRIKDIVGYASDDVWATGWYFGSGSYRPWVLHWNGETWSEEPGVPNPNGEEIPYGIDGTSADDLWVVGDSSVLSDGGALILHRDSGGWSRTVVDGLPQDPDLSDVAVVSPTRAFAVGNTGNGARGLALRWNGTTWRTMPVPEGSTSLNSVDATSASDVVVSGNANGGRFSARWNGSTWRPIVVPDNTRRTTFQIEATDDGSWFAAGSLGRQTGMLHRCVSAL